MPGRDTETVAFSAEHASSDFRSGVAPLDHFFQTQAGQNQRKNVSRTWVLERAVQRAPSRLWPSRLPHAPDPPMTLLVLPSADQARLSQGLS